MTRRSVQVVEATRYLQSQGMTPDDFGRLHHFFLRGKRESFGSVIRYFSKVNDLRANNAGFAERVCYVASQHRQKGTAFGDLVQLALKRWPLSQ